MSGTGPFWGFDDFNAYILHGLLGMRLRSKKVVSPSEPPSTVDELRPLLTETVAWATEQGFHTAKMEHALAHADLEELLASLPELWTGGGW